MTIESIQSMTTLKQTPKRVRLLNDRKEVVAEWPLHLAPKDHADACAQAIDMMREAGVIR